MHPRVPLDVFCRREGKVVCRLCVLDTCRDHADETVEADDLAVELGCVAADLRSACAHWSRAALGARKMADIAASSAAAAAGELDALEARVVGQVTAHFARLRQEASDGWRTRKQALESQAARLAAAETGAGELARVFDNVVPLGRGGGSTPLLPVPVMDHVCSSAAALSDAVDTCTRKWGVIPAADVTGWVSVRDEGIEAALDTLRDAVTLQWQLAPPTQGKTAYDAAGGGVVTMSWTPAVQLAGAPAVTHWLVRLRAGGAAAAGGGDSDGDAITAEAGPAVGGAGAAAAATTFSVPDSLFRSVLTSGNGVVLLAAATTRLTFTAEQACQLCARWPVTLDIIPVRLPAGVARRKASAPSPGDDLFAWGLKCLRNDDASARLSFEPDMGVAAICLPRILGNRYSSEHRSQEYQFSFSFTSPVPVWLFGFTLRISAGPPQTGMLKLFSGQGIPAGRNNGVADADVGAGGNAPLAVSPVSWEQRGDMPVCSHQLRFRSPVLLRPGLHYAAYLHVHAPRTELFNSYNWSATPHEPSRTAWYFVGADGRADRGFPHEILFVPSA